MAKIEDLIAQIPDERLRTGIAAEVKALKKTKKFGLVFEEHLPETVRLPRLPVKPGELVALKREAGNQLWRVKTIHKNIATCDRAVTGYPATGEANKEFPISDLVVVRSFGDAIYPALVPVDRVERGGPNKPWHLLINADNFHALQLLLYSYEGKVDVIYIDPPYNTGARDWKYNNDYVDKGDSFRHSKWLSMMKRRLLLAKRLLKPNGVLIVTIDDNEVNHLGVLLEEIFAEYQQHLITIVINPGGTFKINFARVHEYAYFVCPKDIPVIEGRPMSSKSKSQQVTKDGKVFDIWKLRRTGTESSFRHQRSKQFYAIFVDPKTGEVKGVGDEIPKDAAYSKERVNGLISVYPIDGEGNERVWRYGRATMKAKIDEGVIIARIKGSEIGLFYLSPAKTHERLKTVWWEGNHSSVGTAATVLVDQILGKPGAFPFPKSLFAVRDALASVCADRPDALVLDFFAGSGTTYHSICALNVEDGGKRRSILVSYDEVQEKIAKQLHDQEIFPGDERFENHGICSSVTWPRCKAVTSGMKADGSPIEGEFPDDSALEGRSYSEGFEENIEYFRLDFLNPDEVARGDAFQAVLPILWMMAGCRGKREDSKGSQSWFFPKQAPFAVLIKEKEFRAFREALAERKDIEWIFIVTDSEENFGMMRRTLGRKFHCVQLYKNYLENFRINTPDMLSEGGVA
jgi:adenine-specific DNA-methyltransferase